MTWKRQWKKDKEGGAMTLAEETELDQHQLAKLL